MKVKSEEKKEGERRNQEQLEDEYEDNSDPFSDTCLASHHQCHSEQHAASPGLRGHRGDACRQGSLRRALSSHSAQLVRGPWKLGSHPRLLSCVLLTKTLAKVDGPVQTNTIGGRDRCIGGSACWCMGGS